MRSNGKSPRSSFFILAVLLAFLLTGCAHRIGDFSVLSSGTPQYAAMESATITQSVEGKDSRFWFLFIPFGGPPNLEEAVDRCLDEGKGDFIERVRLYQSGWSILLFSYGGYTVIGDVGNSKIPRPGTWKTEADYVPAAPAAVPVSENLKRTPAAVPTQVRAPRAYPAETVAGRGSESLPIQTEDLGGLFLEETP